MSQNVTKWSINEKPSSEHLLPAYESWVALSNARPLVDTWESSTALPLSLPPLCSQQRCIHPIIVLCYPAVPLAESNDTAAHQTGATAGYAPHLRAASTRPNNTL